MYFVLPLENVSYAYLIGFIWPLVNVILPFFVLICNDCIKYEYSKSTNDPVWIEPS